MKFSARQISEILGGIIDGDAEVCVDRLSKIEEGGEGSISFLANPKYTQYIYQTTASIVIVNKDFTPTDKISATLIRVDNAYTAFTTILEFYDNYLKSLKKGIEQPSFQSEKATLGKDIYLAAFSYVGDGAVIGDGAKIYPHVYIGDNVTIGEGTTIYAGAKIYSGCNIGRGCIIHAGVVIGADGFGFAPQADGSYKKIPQTGGVTVEDYVEIGANTAIDRATMGNTVIKRGTKLDNLIQVAHNVCIGENTVMAAQSGVAGSTKIGSNCVIAGQVGMAGHLEIGDKVTIGAQTGIMANVKEGSTIMGTPAMNHKDFFKSQVYFRRLPQMAKEINEINKKLKEE